MELDSIHNYFERLVFNEIKENYIGKELSEEQLTDMACLALNQIPPRYIRYDIDMSFFMTPQQHHEVEQKVALAVETAYHKMLDLEKPEVSASFQD